MSTELDARLARHQKDYTTVTGNPFSHFFCPVLWTDEPTELCLGHVVNRAFSNSAGTRVVQRKDLDGFYGSVFESEFEAYISSSRKPLEEIAHDAKLSKIMRPRMIVDGEECEFYQKDDLLSEHTKLPSNHLGIHVTRDKGQPLNFVLKKHPDEIRADGSYWEIALEGDCRIAALVSLIKSAHLTLFAMLGYRYALSSGGEFVGRQILASFYRQHVGEPRKKARKAANLFFREFTPMMNEVGVADYLTIRGTVEDKQVAICYGSSGDHFAIGVFVRINAQLFCILMPAFDHPDAVPTYLEFLSNSNEKLAVKIGRYNHEERRWESDDCGPRRIPWPKDQESR